MFALAAAKKRTGHGLNNPVLISEARVTAIDRGLACAVLLGLAVNTTLGWWWADPATGLIIALYAVREARTLHGQH
jgi:divalent metal cation (Fe/Co/Zn/Cd) transporter